MLLMDVDRKLDFNLGQRWKYFNIKEILTYSHKESFVCFLSLIVTHKYSTWKYKHVIVISDDNY